MYYTGYFFSSDERVAFYALMKAAGHKEGQRAEMTSGPWEFEKGAQTCIQIYCYFYGDQIGSLSVDVHAAGHK